MGLTREEIQVQLGIDNSQVQPGLDRAGRYIEHFGDKMVGKFNRLLGVSVFHTALNLVKEAAQEILPTAEEFWNAVYDVDVEGGKRQEEFNKKMAGLRTGLGNVRDLFAKKAADFIFKRADDAEKLNILKQQKEEQDANEANASYELLRLEKLRKQNELMGSHHTLIREIATAQKKLLEEQTRTLEVDEKIAEVNERIAREKKREHEEERRERAERDRAENRAYDKMLSDKEHLSKAETELQFHELSREAERDPGGWTRGHSGWGGRSRFVPSRAADALAALTQKNKWLLDPLHDLRDQAKRSADALQDFKENGMPVKTGE